MATDHCENPLRFFSQWSATGISRILNQAVATPDTNTIAFAVGAGGVQTISGSGNAVGDAAGTGNAILHNAMFDNAGLGIHLTNGGNNNQSPPTLAASAEGGVITVPGTLHGQPFNNYTIQLFTHRVAALSPTRPGK